MTFLRAGWRWLAVDPHQRQGLRVLQIIFGSVLLLKMFTYAPLAAALWGPNGMGRDRSLIPFFGSWAGGLLDQVFWSLLGTQAVFVAVELGALGLIFGTSTRLANGLALLGFTLLRVRFHFIQGEDDLIYLGLVYMLLTLPPGENPPRGALRVWLHNIGVLAIEGQVMIVYFIAGFSKAFGDQWQHGTALYYAAQTDLFSSGLMRFITQSPWMTGIGTYTTVFYPLLFPAAIISPIRVPWLVFGMTFHLLTGVLMGLWVFGTVMIGLDLFLINDREFTALRRWARARLFPPAPAPSVRLYIDGFCSICRSTAQVISAFDWRGHLEIASFRDSTCVVPPHLTRAQLETEMTLVDLRTGKTAGGFEAVRALARHLPVLWPLQPVLAVIAWSGWGGRAYRYLAEHRKMVPDPRACGTHDGNGANRCAPEDEPSAAPTGRFRGP